MVPKKESNKGEKNEHVNSREHKQKEQALQKASTRDSSGVTERQIAKVVKMLC